MSESLRSKGYLPAMVKDAGFSVWQVRELAVTQFLASHASHVSIGGEVPSYVAQFAAFLSSPSQWAAGEARMNRWTVDPMHPPTRPHPRKNFWGDTVQN